MAIALVCFAAGAQTPSAASRYHEKGSGIKPKSITSGTIDKMIGGKVDAPDPSIPYGYKGYNDERLDELDKQMKERQWQSEDTAWKRACELDTRLSYETYITRYPQGAHVAEANNKVIEKKVDETLANAHDNLPNIKYIEPDEFSPTSTLSIKNNTGYPLTVYCSGSDKKSVIIPVDATRDVTVTNGDYKIAASVPPGYIRPFAGQTTFYGGTYEIGFWVVTTYY